MEGEKNTHKVISRTVSGMKNTGQWDRKGLWVKGRVGTLARENTQMICGI